MPTDAVDTLKPLRFRSVPVVSVGFLVMGAAGVVASFVATNETVGWRLGTGLMGVALVTISAAIIRKTLARVEIGDSHIRYRTMRTEVELPLSAATKIVVGRRHWFQSATTFDLIVLLGNDEHRLRIGSHYYVGSHQQRRAETIARRLGIELVDPLGDEWRRGNRLRRLFASGHKWVLVLAVIAVPALIVLMAAVALTS